MMTDEELELIRSVNAKMDRIARISRSWGEVAARFLVAMTPPELRALAALDREIGPARPLPAAVEAEIRAGVSGTKARH